MFELKKVQRSFVWWNAKVEGKMTCASKNGMRNLVNVHQSTFKSVKIGTFFGRFIQSRKCMSVKFTGELCVMTMKNDAKFEEKLTCQFKIDMKNLTNFHPNFNELLLTKVYNVWTEKVQRSYFWWHWRLMQNLTENWLVLSIMTWRIWQIFVHRLKNSNFILESKKVEFNQNKNSKHQDWPGAGWKLYFTFEINE